jgi:hypothetical protein
LPLARLPPLLAFSHLVLGPRTRHSFETGLWIHPTARQLLPVPAAMARLDRSTYRSSWVRGSEREPDPVVAVLSPGRQLPLVELNRSSAPADFERYRPIGSAIPLRRRTGLEVFPFAIRASAVESASNAQAPTNLLSPSESDRNRPPAAQPLTALLGFGPFQRLELQKPGYLGFASPDTFRLQGFSPSCRLTSSATVRPCFMPVTLLGFSFRAFSPRRAFDPSRNRLPSWC